jgi:hypothetical protein
MVRLQSVLAVVFLSALVNLSGVQRAAAADPDGWSIEQDSHPNTCVASGPVSGEVELAIAVLGPQFQLLISSAAFKFPDGTYLVSISINGSAPVTFNAVGESNVYGVALVRPLGMALRSASELTVTVGGKSYPFTLQHADAAMDAASKCAGERTYLEVFAHPPTDIAQADGWKLVDPASGTNQCSIRLNGAEIDTMLMRNNDGKLIVMAGRGEWAFPPGNTSITLQIDDGQPKAVDAFVLQNVVLVLLKDDSGQAQLSHATDLRWHFSWGDFHATFSGLDVALEALDACNRRISGETAK